MRPGDPANLNEAMKTRTLAQLPRDWEECLQVATDGMAIVSLAIQNHVNPISQAMHWTVLECCQRLEQRTGLSQHFWYQTYFAPSGQQVIDTTVSDN